MRETETHFENLGEKIKKKRTIDKIADADTFSELIEFLGRREEIIGSHGRKHKTNDLIPIIKRIISLASATVEENEECKKMIKELMHSITRKEGLRDKIYELVKKEEGKNQGMP